MKLKQNIIIKIITGVFILSLIFLTNCSRRETSRIYYNPAWTADGKIMAVKESRIGYSVGGLDGGSSGYDSNSYIVI